METPSLAGNRLQQRRHTAAGAAQHKQHLAALDDAVKVPQDVNLLAALAQGLLHQHRGLPEDVEDVLLVVRVGAVAVDAQAAVGDPGLEARIVLGVASRVLEQSPCPLLGVELLSTAGVEGRVGREEGVDVGVESRCRADELEAVRPDEIVHSRGADLNVHFILSMVVFLDRFVA